jgi:cathepsin L
MNNKLVVLSLVLGLAAIAIAEQTKWHQLNGYTFENYVSEFGKHYANEAEYTQRKAIFENRLINIRKHNEDDTLTWKRGVNQLSDRTEEEFAQLRGYKKNIAYASKLNRPVSNIEYPTVKASFVDWRLKGIISDVKDQGQCGSCWTFSATESVESYSAIKTGQLQDLSEQQILDCTPNPDQCGGTGGCQGGTYELAWNQITATGGLTSEWQYPYISYFGSNYNCHANQTTPFVKVAGFVDLPANELSPVLSVLSTIGPLSISVDASTWSEYESGVYDGCNQTNPDLDHAVQLVGMGTDAKFGDYWLVRNSWSPTWGEKGYIRLRRTETPRCGIDVTPQDGDACKNGPKTQQVCGTCGILFDAAYPLIANS